LCNIIKQMSRDLQLGPSLGSVCQRLQLPGSFHQRSRHIVVETLVKQTSE